MEKTEQEIKPEPVKTEVVIKKSGGFKNGCMLFLAGNCIGLLCFLVIALIFYIAVSQSIKSPDNSSINQNNIITPLPAPTSEPVAPPTSTEPSPQVNPDATKIRSLNYKSLIPISTESGDAYLDPVFADLTGDGVEEGVFAYRLAGTGGYVNIYVYTYENGSVKQLLYVQEVPKGTFEVTSGKLLKVTGFVQDDTLSPPASQVTIYQWNNSTQKFEKV